MYTHIYICIYIYIYIYIYDNILYRFARCGCMGGEWAADPPANIYIYIYTHIYIYIYIYICIYMYRPVYIYNIVFVYLFTYTVRLLPKLRMKWYHPVAQKTEKGTHCLSKSPW